VHAWLPQPLTQQRCPVGLASLVQSPLLLHVTKDMAAHRWPLIGRGTGHPLLQTLIGCSHPLGQHISPETAQSELLEQTAKRATSQKLCASGAGFEHRSPLFLEEHLSNERSAIQHRTSVHLLYMFEYASTQSSERAELTFVASGSLFHFVYWRFSLCSIVQRQQVKFGNGSNAVEKKNTIGICIYDLQRWFSYKLLKIDCLLKGRFTRAVKTPRFLLFLHLSIGQSVKQKRLFRRKRIFQF